MYFSRWVGLRSANCIILAARKLLFERAENSCNREGHDEVEHADDRVGLEGLEAHCLDRACNVVKLCNTDNVEYRGILDVDNELV